MKLKDFFSHEKRWTKGAWARDEFAEGCQIENGHSFCLIGAVTRFYVGNYSAVTARLAQVITELYPDRSKGLGTVICFNDAEKTTFADIRRVLEKADV